MSCCKVYCSRIWRTGLNKPLLHLCFCSPNNILGSPSASLFPFVSHGDYFPFLTLSMYISLCLEEGCFLHGKSVQPTVFALLFNPSKTQSLLEQSAAPKSPGEGVAGGWKSTGKLPWGLLWQPLMHCTSVPDLVIDAVTVCLCCPSKQSKGVQCFLKLDKPKISLNWAWNRLTDFSLP